MSETHAPSEAPAPWVNHWHVVLPNPNRPALAMLPTAAGWALPYVRDENEIWLSEAGAIVTAVRPRLGLTGAWTLLRYLSAESSEAERWTRLLLVLEPHDSAPSLPPGAVWVTEADLALLPLAQPEQRAALLEYFAELRTGEIPATRAPWARGGWFAAAVSWIEQSLVELGYTITGPVEQLRNWSISSLLRVPTAAGTVYFKAAADLPLFVNEPVIAATLARLFPAHILPPLRIDPDRRWLLMPDFGPPLRDQPGSDFAPILTLYAALQYRSAEHVDELRAAGAHDRRLGVLAAQIDPLLAHPITQAAFPPDDLAALQAQAEALKARCNELERAGLPATLLHGDLHLGNVAQRNGAPLFFDWTDACIGHPFFDMLETYFFTEDAAEQARLREAYLEPWAAYAPRTQLRELWVFAKPLAALHHAVSYLTIIDNVEPRARHELEQGLPTFLRHALVALRAEES